MFSTRMLAASCLALVLCGGAHSLDVSVTIEGSIEDIIRMLEEIQRSQGPGGPIVPAPPETPRLRVHSMTVGTIEEGEAPRRPVPGSVPAHQAADSARQPMALPRVPNVQPGPAPLPDTPPEAPTPRLEDPVLQPSAAAPGATLSARVEVADPDAAVDMVEAQFAVPGGLTLDLFDNGSRGDDQPGDGTWTRTVPIPPQTPPGDYLVTFTAYDVNGQPVEVTAPDGSKGLVRTYTSITVLPAAQDSPVLETPPR